MKKIVKFEFSIYGLLCRVWRETTRTSSDCDTCPRWHRADSTTSYLYLMLIFLTGYKRRERSSLEISRAEQNVLCQSVASPEIKAHARCLVLSTFTPRSSFYYSHPSDPQRPQFYLNKSAGELWTFNDFHYCTLRWRAHLDESQWIDWCKCKHRKLSPTSITRTKACVSVT